MSLLNAEFVMNGPQIILTPLWLLWNFAFDDLGMHVNELPIFLRDSSVAWRTVCLRTNCLCQTTFPRSLARFFTFMTTTTDQTPCLSWGRGTVGVCIHSVETWLLQLYSGKSSVMCYRATSVSTQRRCMACCWFGIIQPCSTDVEVALNNVSNANYIWRTISAHQQSATHRIVTTVAQSSAWHGLRYGHLC